MSEADPSRNNESLDFEEIVKSPEIKDLRKLTVPGYMFGARPEGDTPPDSNGWTLDTSVSENIDE